MTDAESSGVINRAICWLLQHDLEIVRDDILEGRDYVEIEWLCHRCGWSKTEVKGYNEIE